MKLTLETLKRIIKEELDEIRQSTIKPQQFGNLTIDYYNDQGALHGEGFHLLGGKDPVELEILIKKAIEAGKLPRDMMVDMSVVDKTVYLKPANYDEYRNLKQVNVEVEKLSTMLKKVGLSIQEETPLT